MADEEGLFEPILNQVKLVNTAIGGLIEGSSGGLTANLVKTFWEKANEAFPDSNYHLLKAIRRSYLQAALQVCIKRGEQIGIPLGLWIPELKTKEWNNAAKNFISKAYDKTKRRLTQGDEVLGITSTKTREQSVISNKYPELPVFSGVLDNSKYEAQWLYEVYHSLKAELNRIDSMPNLSVYTQPELLLAAEGKDAKERLENIKAELIESISAEIPIFHARYGLPFYENLTDRQKQSIQEGLFNLIKNGWEETAPDESNLRQDWFGYMCANFRHQIKFKPEISRIFNARQLAKLTTRDERTGEEITIELTREIENKFEAWGGFLSIKMDKTLSLLETQSEQLSGINERLDELTAVISIAGDEKDFVENKLKKWLSGELETVAQIISEEIGKSKNEILNRILKLENVVRQIVPEKSEAQNLVSLPSLRDKVYGREEELRLLQEFLERGKQFGIIVAPTCFGKTYLIKKFLWTITEIGGVKSEYRRFVEKVVYLDCRENQTMTRILQSFANLLGEELKYQQSEEKHFLRDLFTKIQTEKILLIFDNFESWIDENGRYSVRQTSDSVAKDESIETFLNALFNSQHQIRGIFVSQKFPNSERDFVRQVEGLKRVGDELEEGLNPEAALELARKEGANVGLGKVSADALERFFQKVRYIPQAIQSMIGYLETVGENFTKFEREFWEDFDREERDDQNIENRLSNKLRPTKALIKRQILAQNETTKFLLSVLAFFGVSVPKEALALSLSDVKKNENAADRSRAVKALIDNRLAKNEIDLVKERDEETGTEEEITYFTLHPYLQEVVIRELPDNFETQNLDILLPFAQSLFAKGYVSTEQTYFRKAIGFYECVEKIYEHLIFRHNFFKLRNNLAMIYMNKAISLDNLGRLDEAIAELEKTIKIREQLVGRENRLDLKDDLAIGYLNRSVSLGNVGRLNEAIVECNKAIEIYKQLVFLQKRLDLRNYLAMAYLNKAVSLRDLKQSDEADAEYIKSIDIYEELIFKDKRLELRNNLATAYMNRAILLTDLERLDDAIIEFKKSIDIREQLVTREKRLNLKNDLALTYMNKGFALHRLQRLYEGIAEYDKAINLWVTENTWHNLPNLLIGLKNKNTSLIGLKDWQKTAQNASSALQLATAAQHPTFSTHFKRSVSQEIDDILRQIKELTDREKAEIYRFASEQGEDLRKRVEAIGTAKTEN